MEFEIVIEAINLTKLYGDRAAVSGVSFRVNEGDILGFLGPNGAGKSTTMRMLTCLVPPNEGTAHVAGFDVRTQSLDVRRTIGYMAENVPAYSDMLVSEYLAFIAELKDVPRKQRKSQIEKTLEECGLSQVVNRRIGNLSRGYRQRVGLAQALVSDPPVLILDEPTSGLDPQQIVEIRNLIQSFAGHKTVILSTHILPEVSMTCSRAVIIGNGRIVAEGPLDEITTDLVPAHGINVTARGSKSALETALKRISAIKRVKSLKSAGEDHSFSLEIQEGAEVRGVAARAITEAGGDLLELRTSAPTLEEVFLQAVSGASEGRATAAKKGADL